MRRSPGGLGGTYAGNPLSCAAALAVLDVFEEEKLLDRSNAIGQRLKAGIEASAAAQRSAADRRHSRPGRHDRVRYRQGARLRRRRMRPRPSRVTQSAFENGLVLLSCGTNANTIRILVPLTASDAIIDEGLGLLENPRRREPARH